MCVRVYEAEDLSMWSCFHGNIDPYCTVSLCPNTPGAKAEVKRGPCKKKTTKPNFQDTFSFLVSHTLCLPRERELQEWYACCS